MVVEFGGKLATIVVVNKQLSRDLSALTMMPSLLDTRLAIQTLKRSEFPPEPYKASAWSRRASHHCTVRPSQQARKVSDGTVNAAIDSSEESAAFSE
jgi:hypothetical protein